MKKLLIVIVLAILVSIPYVLRSSETDDKAPEIKTSGKWINTDKPLNLENLKGKVVLLQFWTFGCYNCANTLPHIKDLYAKYNSRGLEIIGIHCPEFDNEFDFNNVLEHVKDYGIKYPVLTDNNFENWYAYDVHAWPTLIIIDKSGNIVMRKVGEGSYQKIESTVSILLSE